MTDWYNNSWDYRKSHVINASAGAGTLYQKMITVHYGAGADNDDDVYCDSKCATDFSDIRFTSSDGTTLLDHWQESKVNSDNAVFWVEVSDDISTNPATIYIYYGSVGQTSASNGANTFPFFDDFSGASLDSTKWTTYITTGSVSLSNGIMTLTGGTASDSSILQKLANFPFFSYNIAVRSLCKFTVKKDGIIGLRDYGLDGNWIAFYDTINTPSPVISHNKANSANFITSNWVEGSFRTFEARRISTNSSFYDNGVQVSNSPITTLVPTVDLGVWMFSGYSGGVGAVMQSDWVLVRKFITSEPTHGAWGEEEVAYVTNTLSYITDVITKTLDTTKVHSIDVLTKKLDTTKTQSTDILFKRLNDELSYPVDVLLNKLSLSTYLIDILNKKQDTTKSYLIDILLKHLNTTLPYLIDFLIKNNDETLLYNIDVLLKKLDMLSLLSLDVELKKLNTIEIYNIDVNLQSVIIGVTRDLNGNPLGFCTVLLFKTSDNSFVSLTTSDSLGNYKFDGESGIYYFVVAYKIGSPNVQGVTENTLIGTGG
jgi:hypothetical protein